MRPQEGRKPLIPQVVETVLAKPKQWVKLLRTSDGVLGNLGVAFFGLALRVGAAVWHPPAAAGASPSPHSFRCLDSFMVDDTRLAQILMAIGSPYCLPSTAPLATCLRRLRSMLSDSFARRPSTRRPALFTTERPSAADDRDAIS